MAATKLDSTTDIYKGQLSVFSGEAPLAFATTATLEVTAEEIDISNKMMGQWAGSDYGRKSFTVSSESFITRKEGACSYATLLSAMVAGTLLDFKFGSMKSADADNFGGTFTLDTTQDNYSGKVMITSLSLTSEQGQYAKCSVSLKGVGALSVVAGTGGVKQTEEAEDDGPEDDEEHAFG